jgi:hypothetical protein
LFLVNKVKRSHGMFTAKQCLVLQSTHSAVSTSSETSSFKNWGFLEWFSFSVYWHYEQCDGSNEGTSMKQFLTMLPGTADPMGSALKSGSKTATSTNG